MANYKISLSIPNGITATPKETPTNVSSLSIEISPAPETPYKTADLQVTSNGSPVNNWELSNPSGGNYIITFNTTGGTTLPLLLDPLTIKTVKTGDSSNILYIDPKESGFTISNNIASKTLTGFKITEPGTTTFYINEINGVSLNVADQTPIVAIKSPTTSNTTIDATVDGSLPSYLTPVIPENGSLNVSVKLSINDAEVKDTTNLQFSISQDLS